MDIDPIKAPRTYAAWKKAYDVVELAKFMVELSQQLECELNESNKIIRQQQLLDKKNLMLEERIKQLEELYEGEIGERPELLDSNVLGLLKRELNFAQKRIKRLEEAGQELLYDNDDMANIYRWHKAKEIKP
jgi:hypothetical protein